MAAAKKSVCTRAREKQEDQLGGSIVMEKIKCWVTLEAWRDTLEVELTHAANWLDVRSETQCAVKPDA